MKYIIEKELCTGCRACEWSCPAHCIVMSADEEGFLYPEIDEKKCIQCGKCRDVCVGYIHRKDSLCFQKTAFAAWSRESLIRLDSSSGGVFYFLARNMIAIGGIVYGAAFDADFMVKHRRVTEMKGILALMGSKYVQSDTAGTYRQVLEDLKSGHTVLYSGTPCQISALLEFIKGYEEKLFTVSVICHGTPSPDIWKKYLDLKKGQYAESAIRKVSFRDKSYGWKDFSVSIVFERYSYLKSHKDDLYMQGFLQNLFLRPSCYQCNAKEFSAGADIVIGDFWGVERELSGTDINPGVSSVIVCSAKGLELWDGIKDYLQFREVSLDAIYRNNSAFWSSVSRNENRESFFKDLAENGLLEEAIKKYTRSAMLSRDERCLYQYDILQKYLDIKIRGKSVGGMLRRFGIKRIILYAVTDLLDLTLKDILSENEAFSVYISDKQFQRLGETYKGVPVVSPQELKGLFEKNEADGIVVCNPVRENEIIDELSAGGIELEKIYSLISLIFD